MNNIKKYREAIKLSQEELAIKLNVTQGTVSQWESGITNPRVGMLSRLAGILNCTIDDMFKQNEETA